MVEGQSAGEGSGERADVLSLVALCLGLGGLVVATGPAFTVMLGGGAGAAGLVCGVVSKSRRADAGGMAIAGAVCGLLAVGVSVWVGWG